MKKSNSFYNLMCMFVLCAITFSCQTEPIQAEEDDLSAVNGKSKIKKNNDEESNESEGSCETAFAKGSDENSTCFLEIDDLKSNRWGWTIGALSEGSYNFEIFAGAGQCDTDKGALVGNLTVEYVNGTANVVFKMNAGSVLTETHLYIGNDPIPAKKGKLSVAPGQFPYSNTLDNASSDSYTVENLSGDIYVIAHAVVCEGETIVECPVEPIRFCGGVRYNFWGLRTFWGGNYSDDNSRLFYAQQEDGSIHITGTSRMNGNPGCLATVDVWLVNPKNYVDWTAGGGMANIPDNACSTVSPEDLMYFIVDESRSTIIVSECADGDDRGGTYDVLHQPKDFSKGFQVGPGGSLYQAGSQPGLSGWFYLRKQGTDKIQPADFNFLLCE